MRQRLGLAHALLGDPRVLILDEPANGLDPEGIFWMRGLLRDFADRGGTVLLSSHLLREVEAVADRLVVIGGGRIVAQGDKDELLGRRRDAGAGPRPARRCGGALDRAGLAATGGADGGCWSHADAEAVGQAAADAGVVLTELRPAGGGGLEQLFLTLTAGATTKEAVPMTAATATARPPPTAPGAMPGRRPSLPRLTGVELRKLADTRAGCWLLIAIGLLAAAIVAVQLVFAGRRRADLPRLLHPVDCCRSALLLPVLGILSITSEWSQRTALTTFALVPRRGG